MQRRLALRRGESGPQNARPCGSALLLPCLAVQARGRIAPVSRATKKGGPAARPEPPETRRYSIPARRRLRRSEEHTSELQLLMRTAYAVICLKKKKGMTNDQQHEVRTVS